MRPAERAAAAVAAAAVGAQILYPLLSGRALVVLTVAVVLLWSAASLAHAAATAGAAAAAAVLVVAGGVGFAAETVGVATGVPFGPYAYAGTLGPQVAGVPLVIGLAWTMLAWPVLLLARRLARGLPPGPARAAAVTALGGATLAAWDLFLDPQMTAAGHWAFADPEPGLPGIPGIPLTNYAGWLLVSTIVVGTLHLVLPRTDTVPQAVPAALLAWTWLGSALANAVFFDRPWVALWGGVVMGLFVAPYLAALARDRTRERSRTPALAPGAPGGSGDLVGAGPGRT